MGRQLVAGAGPAAHADRETVRAAFGRLFERADALLTPAVPHAPPRIEDERANLWLRYAVLAYTAPQHHRRAAGGASCRAACSSPTGPPESEPLLLSVASMLGAEHRSP